jgi:matrix metalloproteinase-14 (membrane-inserted)
MPRFDSAELFFRDLMGGPRSPRRAARRPARAAARDNGAADRVFDQIARGEAIPSEVLLDDDERWVVVASPGARVPPHHLAAGDLVMRRALGEGRLVVLLVLGADIQPRQLYRSGSHIAHDVLVLRRAADGESLDDARSEQIAEDVLPAAHFGFPLNTALVWNNGNAYFFKGDEYVKYALKPRGAQPGYPKKIRDHWPGLFERDIDAAVVWNDGYAYFFKGDEYVAYSMDPKAERAGQRKKIKTDWPGVWERDIDAAVVWPNGKAYFFKGDKYIACSMDKKAEADNPRLIASFWAGGLGGGNINAAVVWAPDLAYFFMGDRYIAYSISPEGATPLKRIRKDWKSLAALAWRASFFPPRPKGAPGGKEIFTKAPEAKDWAKREKVFVDQLIAGNMPDALLRWVTIPVSYTANKGTPKERTIRGTVQVLPDYLMIGEDFDFVHVPLDPMSAQKVADAFGVLLPTARICQAIYEHTEASRRIGAITRTPSESTTAYLAHSLSIQKRMDETKPDRILLGELVAGHKKDVVLAKRSPANVGAIAFHGFYDAKGFPFEPCYEPRRSTPDPRCATDKTMKERTILTHDLGGTRLFSDYSQGVRLVHPVMRVDGKRKLVATVLADAELSYLISSDGPVDPPRIPKPPTFKEQEDTWPEDFSEHGGVLELDDMPHYTDPRTRWPRTFSGTAAAPRAVWMTRSEWGADTSIPRLGATVAATDRTEVFIHHTVTPNGGSTPNEWETLDKVKGTMRGLQRSRPELGLDVPYNVVAFCMSNGDLVLCEGRGLERSGAHTPGRDTNGIAHNTSAIAISFAGNFERSPPPRLDDQLRLLSNWLLELWLCRGFTKLGSVRPAGREVWGHRDVDKTACPGAELFSRLGRITFLR